MVVCTSSELQHSFSSVSIYYEPQSDIRVKSYGRLYWLRASTFKSERLNMLRDSIRHPRKKLLSFELAQRFNIQFRASRYITDSIRHPSKKLWSFVLAQSFNIQFRASRYVTGLNQTSEKNVIVVWVVSEIQHSISSVSIYYGTQSDIRVKSYCRLNWLRASTFNLYHLDLLRDSIRHPRKKLLSFEFAQRFNIQFHGSRFVTGLKQTSEKKVIVVWIGSELQHSISSVSICYGTQSDIREKRYCRLN